MKHFNGIKSNGIFLKGVLGPLKPQRRFPLFLYLWYTVYRADGIL